MSKAEEASLKVYPPTYTTVKRHAKKVQSERVDTHQPVRAIFQQGYEQAEKDNVLTWEDIRTIFGIVDDLENEGYKPEYITQAYCEEILRRFNKDKATENVLKQTQEVIKNAEELLKELDINK